MLKPIRRVVETIVKLARFSFRRAHCVWSFPSYRDYYLIQSSFHFSETPKTQESSVKTGQQLSFFVYLCIPRQIKIAIYSHDRSQACKVTLEGGKLATYSKLKSSKRLKAGLTVIPGSFPLLQAERCLGFSRQRFRLKGSVCLRRSLLTAVQQTT